MDLNESEVNIYYNCSLTSVFAYPLWKMRHMLVNVSISFSAEDIHRHHLVSFQKLPAYEKPVFSVQCASNPDQMCFSPGRRVCLAAWETNVCVRRQACTGLAGFLISCPITSVHLLKGDISPSLCTVRSAHTQTEPKSVCSEDTVSRQLSWLFR